MDRRGSRFRRAVFDGRVIVSRCRLLQLFAIACAMTYMTLNVRLRGTTTLARNLAFSSTPIYGYGSLTQASRVPSRFLQSVRQKAGSRTRDFRNDFLDAQLRDSLGVAQDAAISEIEQAFFEEAQVASLFGKTGSVSPSRFQEVAEAYAILAGPTIRERYNKRGDSAATPLDTNFDGATAWRVLLGRTDHWAWGGDKSEYMFRLLASSIPSGIVGVTEESVRTAYQKAYNDNVAILLEGVSEEQAQDTVAELEKYGLAVKAEPIGET